jgi:hypothetical protein
VQGQREQETSQRVALVDVGCQREHVILVIQAVFFY